jgi:hypothetical protein
MMLQAHVTTYFNADNIAAQQIIAGNRNQKPKPMRRFGTCPVCCVYGL